MSAPDPAGQPRRCSRADAGDLTVVVERGRRRDEIGMLWDAVAGYRDSLGRSRELAAAAELERNRLQAAVSQHAGRAVHVR